MCTGGFNGVYVTTVTGGSTAEKCIKEGKPSMIISPICRIWVSVKSGTGPQHPGTFPEHPHNTPKTPRHPCLRFLNFHTFSCLSFLRPRQHGSGQSFERTKLARIRFSFTWGPCTFFEGQTVPQTLTEFIRTRVNRVLVFGSCTGIL